MKVENKIFIHEKAFLVLLLVRRKIISLRQISLQNFKNFELFKIPEFCHICGVFVIFYPSNHKQNLILQ